MKFLIILLLLISCGKKIDVDVRDSSHEVIHKFELPDVELICEQQNPDGTNEELDACVATYKSLLEGL